MWPGGGSDRPRGRAPPTLARMGPSGRRRRWTRPHDLHRSRAPGGLARAAATERSRSRRVRPAVLHAAAHAEPSAALLGAPDGRPTPHAAGLRPLWRAAAARAGPGQRGQRSRLARPEQRHPESHRPHGRARERPGLPAAGRWVPVRLSHERGDRRPRNHVAGHHDDRHVALARCRRHDGAIRGPAAVSRPGRHSGRQRGAPFGGHDEPEPRRQQAVRRLGGRAAARVAGRHRRGRRGGGSDRPDGQPS